MREITAGPNLGAIPMVIGCFCFRPFQCRSIGEC